MAGLILALNSGSSTLKGSLVEPGATVPAATTSAAWGDPKSTLEQVLGDLGAGSDVFGVAHRVVHGGPRFTRPVLIDDAVLQEIDRVSELAPLHNDIALDVIRLARRRFPNLPHVACFDTAFHSTMSEVAWRYPVPYDWGDRWGVRRFGFHGLSVEWSVRSAARSLQRAVERTDVVVAHLGSGCSVTAVASGRSAWTSMGFTPLEGLMMATRSGSIDPGVIFHVVAAGGMPLATVQDELEHRSGLTGVSGASGDLREVRATADRGSQRARLAIDMFVARAAETIAAALTWVRAGAVVFTGGIGEHDDETRLAILERLQLPAGIAVLTVTAREDIVMADATATLVR
jgi:acetate kinase